MEMSVARAWRTNQFLQTGDTTYLYGPSINNVDYSYILFWTRLYEYNRRLPAASKIVIHGVDFETTAVFTTLQELAPSGQHVPISLLPLMDTVATHIQDKPLHMWDVIDNKFVLYDNSGFEKTLRYVQSQLRDHDVDVRAYFGNNYPVVLDIATNRSRVEVKAKHRNTTMFAAIEKTMKEQGVDRFVAFFGNQHTSYQVHNSLPNALKRLKGIGRIDIITLAEFAYDVNSKDTAFRPKGFQELVNLNGSCKATLLPSDIAPGYQKQADFIFIANITK